MNNPVKIDVIILSYSKTNALRELTEQAIDSLLSSENKKQISFNTVVIESSRSLSPYQFNNTLTLYPEVEFGFNRYLNIGMSATGADYICFCNNDLVFHAGWATAILEEMQKNPAIASASTFCPVNHQRSGFHINAEPLEGYENLFSGWCFLVRRDVFDVIGPFDEDFKFWYADADYLKTLQKHYLKNFLIPRSHVTHLNAVTSEHLSRKDRFELTLLPLLYFNYKWGRDNYITYLLKYMYFYLQFKIQKL